MAPPKDPYRYFRLEARELVDQLDGGAIALEKGEGDAELVQRLLRYAHTLKGAARVVKQVEIANQAHAIEDILSPLRDEGRDTLPRPALDELLARMADIRSALQALAAPEPAGAPRETPPADEILRTIRTDIGEVDLLLDGLSEAYAQISALRGATGTIEQAQHMADLLLAQLAPRNRNEVRRAGDPLDRAFAMAEDLADGFGAIERRLTSAIDLMDRELRQLRDMVEQMRLVSAGVLFGSLERTASEAARMLGKRVRFAASGGDIRLDAHILDGIQGALVQLVRNAVAHGIEQPERRESLGKPAVGLLSIDVVRRGGEVLFECRDDGGGLDLEALRRIAAERGIGGPDVRHADAGELLTRMVGSGISTAGSITELSGRGIGLDIVRDAAARLKGRISVESAKGEGTAFRIRVPLSLSSMDALTVELSGSTLSLPLDSVESALRVSAKQIASTQDGASILHEGSSIPFLPLTALFREAPPEPGRDWSTIVVRGSAGRAAIGVDRLLGTSRIVARPLPAQTPCDAVVAGASLDAEGNPRLLLDANALVAAAIAGAAGLPEARGTSLPILVIDDSLTTRMLEQSILEAAGYEVDTATSAEEGLEAARRKAYALFLVDVEMPGMDGFAFVDRIRADPALHAIPAILVTSRNAPEDFERGREAGAQGYMVKSEFDQTRLLGLIRELAA